MDVELITQVYRTSVSITAIKTKDKKWMSIERGLDKEDIRPYTMEYYSAVKKNGMMPFAAACMDLEIIILSDVSQRQISYHLYMRSKKNGTNEFIYKTETDSQISKSNLQLPKRKCGEEG